MERLTQFDPVFDCYKVCVDNHTLNQDPEIFYGGLPRHGGASWLMGEIVERLAYYENTIVHCKDCIHRHSSEFCECRPPDGFCNDGERGGADAY